MDGWKRTLRDKAPVSDVVHMANAEEVQTPGLGGLGSIWTGLTTASHSTHQNTEQIWTPVTDSFRASQRATEVKDVPLRPTSPRMGDALHWFRLNKQEPVSTITQPGSGPVATELTDLLLLDPLMGSWRLSHLQPDHCGTFARWLFVDYSTTVSSSRGEWF